ncbi:MAG: YncE family protein [Bacteroidales bacterium]|nr:YncE family protein [Bacteroidales bacterium]
MKIIQGLTFTTLLLIAALMMNFTQMKDEVYSETPVFVTDIKVATNEGVFMSQKGTKSVVLYKKDFSEKVQEWAFDEIPTAIAVTENFLCVTTFETKGLLHIIDLKTNKIYCTIPVGSGATAPVVHADQSKVYVCNQFANTVSEIDIKKQKQIQTVKVLREPRAAIISPDGKLLFVANYLPAQRADVDTIAACISVINLSNFKKIKDIQLTNGSNAVQGLCLSPDANYLFATHNLGRFQVPTSQLQQGWMNTSAMSVINLQTQRCEGAVLLDEPDRGAGGLWSVECAEKEIIVSQYGTHEISVIDYPAFIEKYNSLADKSTLNYDLRFLNGIRRRVPLIGNGPRAFSISGDKVIIPTYFSDTVNVYDLKTQSIEAFSLVKNRQETDAQKGERYFNDATYCYQNWQSCNGCHPGEARTDGMNWDLMNDGIGNSKNCKSLILSHETPPSMISGIRERAELAVRKGYNLIQFYDIPESKAVCVDMYLKSLKPVPSPYLVDGKLSDKAVEGRQVFEKFDCARCHSGSYYTDMKMHRIGDSIEFEKGWDTPTLIEVWRTAPYLFNGKAETLKDVFEKYKHGIDKKISEKELDELVEYINSL